MNLKTYAQHRKTLGLRGSTHVAVLKAINTGRLSHPAVQQIDGRWQIEPELADEQWANNTNAGSWPPVALVPPDEDEPAAPRPRPLAPDPLDPPEPPGPSDPAEPRVPALSAAPEPARRPRAPRNSGPPSAGPTLAEANRAAAVYKAERLRLALLKDKGELVEAASVAPEASRLGRVLRDALLVIPDRICAPLATMNDRDSIRDMLRHEIEAALRGMANA